MRRAVRQQAVGLFAAQWAKGQTHARVFIPDSGASDGAAAQCQVAPARLEATAAGGRNVAPCALISADLHGHQEVLADDGGKACQRAAAIGKQCAAGQKGGIRQCLALLQWLWQQAGQCAQLRLNRAGRWY
ncbi:hypothetical protein ALQ16_203785 [Pseudomonas syringae pv. actinidiae]|nr:hypothetical protein ALQ16_203785 [Pseudomonas syringae pv. actinidiae]